MGKNIQGLTSKELIIIYNLTKPNTDSTLYTKPIKDLHEKIRAELSHRGAFL